jgi:hypothetical protein
MTPVVMDILAINPAVLGPRAAVFIACDRILVFIELLIWLHYSTTCIELSLIKVRSASRKSKGLK